MQYIKLIMMLMLLLAMVELWLLRPSICLLLYQDDVNTWDEFVSKFTAIFPATEVILLRSAEVDYVAYVDALQDCSTKFKHMVCQIPNAAAGRIIAKRHVGCTVAVASPPELVPSTVIANIVKAEQNYFNALQNLSADAQNGKQLLICSKTCRIPTGWAQVQTDASQINNIPQLIGSRALGGISITDPELATEECLAAICAAYPSAAINAATNSTEPLPQLKCQILPNRTGAAVLAAGMLKLGHDYQGPQTLCVDPIIVKPANNVLSANVTSLGQLKQLSSL